MKKLISILTLASIAITSQAATAVVDVGSAGMRAAQETASDATTMGQYVASVSSTMGKMQQAMSATEQLKNLQGLQKLNAAGQLCELCNATDSQQLNDYRNSINSDLCSQFSNAYKNLTGVTNAANSLQDIMKLLNTDPKAAMLSLQQGTIAAQQTANSTLAQIQLMQAQVSQKQLADEKAGQQFRGATSTISTGL